MGEKQKSVSVWAWMRAVREAPKVVLDGTTKLVLLVLGTYADPDGGNCFPGQKRLASRCGKSERVIRRALRKARQKGFIRSHRRQYGTERTSNLYELVIPEEGSPPVENRRGCGKPDLEPDVDVRLNRTWTSGSAEDVDVRVPAQQEKPNQHDHLSNARARTRGCGKPARRGRGQVDSLAAARFQALWSALVLGAAAPRTWGLKGASYAQMTTALAWTIFNKKLSLRGKNPIRDTAAYFVSLLKAVAYGGEKTVRIWTMDELWELMGSDKSPDELIKAQGWR